MDYEGYFKQRLDALHTEGRYPVFTYLERRCGRFRAFMITASARSNDYLGVGQHSVALEAVQETAGWRRALWVGLILLAQCFTAGD